MTTTKRGLTYAIDYLNSFGVTLIPDDLHKRAGLDIKCDTLAHSLRRAARDGKVSVEYKPDSRGVSIAYYRGVPGWKPQDRPKTTVKAPTFFFFTLKHSPVCSPYMATIEAVLNSPYYSKGCKIWTGTFEAPILVEPEAV